jgi:hypothetical protein
MATRHTIALGDCTLSVAASNGFTDWESIWNHADNADLKKLRPSPFCLRPDDELVLPELRPKVMSVPTGARHKFVVKRPKAHLRLRIVLRDKDGKDQPVSGAACQLELPDDVIVDATTDGDGWADAQVPPQTLSAVLTVAATADRPAMGWSLQVGALMPADDPRGAADRLANLGYGAPGEDPVACLPFALRAFQEDAALTVTGELDDATAQALTKRHGI